MDCHPGVYRCNDRTRQPAPTQPPPGWQVWHDSGSILDIETVTGRIAAGGYQGLAWYDLDGTCTAIRPPAGESWEVRELLATDDDRLLVGHAAGPAIIDSDGTIHKAGWQDDQACQVECLEPLPDGRIVVGTTSGIYLTVETSPGLPMTLTTWEDGACCPPAPVRPVELCTMNDNNLIPML